MCLSTWLSITTFLKKAWGWTNTHWYVPAVLIYTLVLWVMFKRSDAAALKVLQSSRISYEQQMKALRDSHALEIEKRDRALARYEDIINILERDFEENKKKLTEDKKKKVKEYIKKFDEDPEGLAAKIEEAFGIKYNPTEDDSE